MTTAADDPIRDAHAAIVQAIADLKAANITVPMSLHLAAHALNYAVTGTTTPCKSVTPVCRGEGHSGAL